MEIREDHKLKDGVHGTVHQNNDTGDNFAVIGGQYDETFTALSENQVGAVRLTTNRAAHVNLRDSSGSELTISGLSTPTTSNAPSLSNVSYSTSNQTALSSNTSRLMATFYNDADVECYIKLGSTATSSSFTVKLFAEGYYELPRPVYTGAIDCIWASGGSGALRVTEET